MSFFRDIGRILLQEQESGIDVPSSDIVINNLGSEDALAAALDRSLSEPVLIFKHSATCPISAMARRRILHLHEEGDPPVYEVVVQSARPLSQKLEQDLGIRHESPQAIILHKQAPIYDASHHFITVEDIRSAITEVKDT